MLGSQASAISAWTRRNFRIQTDQTDSDLNDGSFTMPHHVKFSRPSTDVVGDSAKGNTRDGMVTITGHVVFHADGESQHQGTTSGSGSAALQCDELLVDSKRRIYVASGNVVYITLHCGLAPRNRAGRAAR